MKPHWFLLIGLVVGLIGGLYYTWEINPVQYYDSYPPLLRANYRADWIAMTAFAHGYADDLRRAEIRLHQLPEAEIRQGLERALDEAVGSGRPVAVLRRMAQLAQHYGVTSPAVQIYATDEGAFVFTPPASTPTATLAPPTPTRTPAPFPTQIPTPTPSPTLDPAQFSVLPTPTLIPPTYRIETVERTCLAAPRIAISVTQLISVTERGEERLERQGIPGIEVWLLWTEGADRAVTGLRPAQGLGYADFDVTPANTYNLYLDQPTGAPFTTLTTTACEEAPQDRWVSWQIAILYTAPLSTETTVGADAP